LLIVYTKFPVRAVRNVT